MHSMRSEPRFISLSLYLSSYHLFFFFFWFMYFLNGQLSQYATDFEGPPGSSGYNGRELLTRASPDGSSSQWPRTY